MSLISGVIIAGIIILSNGLSVVLSNELSGINPGISNGLRFGLGRIEDELRFGWLLLFCGGLVAWATVGGLTVLQHYTIRFLLWWTSTFPWRAQAFLDDTATRILLQRLGGGYRFTHRLLLDYLADSTEYSKDASPVSITTPYESSSS